VLKLKERAPNTINQGRQGLDCKNQDLYARFLYSGWTGMRNQNYSGPLKRKRHSRTVDLRSNGRGRARARWTASCTWRTGPPWTAPKGYPLVLNSVVDQRSNDSGRTQARVAAGFAGERRRAAEARRRRPWTALPAIIWSTSWCIS
jgi:hypothetical protein